jgi:hypothetical protein
LASVVGHRGLGNTDLQTLPDSDDVAVPNRIIGHDFCNRGAIPEGDSYESVTTSDSVENVGGLSLADEWLESR